MATRTTETSPQTIARFAGLIYLLVVPLGIGSLILASSLVVSGDAAATASNILGSELRFRLGIVSDMLATLAMLLTVQVLYRLFKPVSPGVARLMVSLVLAGVPIALLNKLNQYAALFLLGGADYLSVFPLDQLQALASFFLRLYSRGSSIGFIFWGFWLFPLAYLVFKSGFMPKVLAVLLVISGLGYIVDSFAAFLGSGFSIGLYTAWGEVLFILYLLIKGLNVEQWNRRGLAAA